MISSLHAQAGHDPGLDRQLRGGQREGLARHRLRNAVDLEHDAAGMHAGDPELGRALAAAHAHLGRLGRDRHVREDPDPDAAQALQMARDRTPRGLDLARGHPVGLDGLEPISAEVQVAAALGSAVDPALMRLAVFGSLRGKHDYPSLAPAPQFRPSVRPSLRPPACWSWARLSWAIGSWARISPLNTQTLTPQVP